MSKAEKIKLVEEKVFSPVHDKDIAKKYLQLSYMGKLF